MWVRPWLLQREERGAYHNIMAELYATDIPGFTNFMRMTPEFFEIIKTRLEPHLARQATNYRAPISVGEKLALTIRYLATGEYAHHYPVSSGLADPPFPSFYQRSAEPSTMSSPEIISDVLLLQLSGENWKQNSGSGGMFHMPFGALDSKHVALKKPKNSGALYHNYKGFFSIVMLALVDGQYKFGWVDVGRAGSCSDAQIFNTRHLKRKIDDGSIGFPDPAPITQGGRDVPYFILADDTFALKTWLMNPYGRRKGLPTT